MLKITVLVLCCIWIQCQAQADPCETLICENGGICILSFDGKSATCECASGWEGYLCNLDSDNKKQHREELAIIVWLDDVDFEASPLRQSDQPEKSRMGFDGFLIGTHRVIETNAVMDKPFVHVFDMESWIQAEFFMTRQIHRVVTMGHAHKPYWIETYKIAHKVFGGDWFWVHSVETEEVVEFKGNSDNTTAVTRTIPGHREIDFIRLYPVDCHNACALRWEIYGCGPTTTTMEPTMAPTESDESSSEENAAAILNHMTGQVILMISIIAHLIIRQF